MISTFLSFLSALIQLINKAWDAYRAERMRAEVREDVAKEADKANNEARTDAEEHRSRVGGMSDDALYDRLRQYQRD